jgi:hypothetical protein
MAEDWQRSHDDLAGFVPYVEQFLGYWWASFRSPGEAEANLGGTVLLIDVARNAVAAASGSRSPSRRVADYEASLRKS